MTLQSSGSMTIAEIRAELGMAVGAAITFPSDITRALAGVPSGSMVMPTDFYSKSATKFTETGVDSSSGSTQSVAGLDFGGAASTRHIIACVHWEGGSTERTLSSATIGGVSAAIRVQSGHSGGSTSVGSAIIIAAVPTGATGTVSCTFSGSVETMAVGIIRTLGLASASAHDTATVPGEGDTSVSGTINVPANGVLVLCGTGSTNTTNGSMTFTGATERYDKNTGFTTFGGRYGAAMSEMMSVQSNRAIGLDMGVIADSGVELVAASFA